MKKSLKRRRLAPHMKTGKTGEYAAMLYLQGLQYQIMGRNIRINRDEIDIVAFDPVDKVYVFAEVKTRKKMDDDYHPNMNITWQKRRFMARAARRYMTQFPEEIGYRLDVVCVMDGRVVDHYIEVNWS